MTVAAEGTRYNYSGNGSTTIFSFPRPFAANGDLKVYLVAASGVATLQTFSTHYSVSGAGDPSGGLVTFLTAPPTGQTVLIYRDTTATQGLDLDAVTVLPPTSLEAALDRSILLINELKTARDRSLRMADSETVASLPALPIAAARANKVLGFDGDGDPYAATLAETTTPIDIGLTSGSSIPTRDDMDARTDMRLSLVKARMVDIRALTTATYTGGYVYMTGYYAASSYADGLTKGGGWYRLDAADTTSVDNATTVLVDASGRRWKLQHQNTIRLSQCGGYIDNSTDDLFAFNRAISLINAGTIDELVIDAGDTRISGKPNPLTASRWTIRGAGWGATDIRFTTGDHAQAFQIGTDGDTCQRWRIEGLRFSNNLNVGSLTGADPTIWVRNSVQGTIANCAMLDNACFVRLGNGAVSQARRTFINHNHLAPTMIANVALFDFQAFTVCEMTGNYGGAGGTQPASARVFKIAATVGGDGCDGLYVNGGELNFNSADLDHAIEVVLTSLGASNLHFTGGCVDGGAVSNVLITLGSGGTNKTKRLHNMTFTGMRLTCNTSGAAGPGRFMQIDSASDNLISGVSVVGCKIKGAGAFLGTRTGAAADGAWDVTFTGNSIINDNDANGGNVFETNAGGLVITGNIVSHQDEDNTNRFEHFFKSTSSLGKNVAITGNTIKECSSTTGFDLASWSADLLIDSVIRNNSGKPDPALRTTQTTNATVTNLGTTAIPDGKVFRLSGRVMGQRADLAQRASYSFVAVVTASAGTASIDYQLVTTEFESDAAWNCTVDANSANIRIRVTGAAATTINWGLYDFRCEAL